MKKKFDHFTRVARLSLVSCLVLSVLMHSIKARSQEPTEELRSTGGTTLRVATFNVSLYRTKSGELARSLEDGLDQDAKKLAAIIQYVRPDILLLNEIDYEEDHRALKVFLEKYLAVGQGDGKAGKLAAIEYPYVLARTSNTGVDSGLDLNSDGKLGTPEDAWGYGRYPGQYAMAVLSRFPILEDEVRTFQKLPWSAMPNALKPIDPKSNQPYYPAKIWSQLRLSSKSHWDVPIRVDGRILHLLASHPTPPAFDGAEDRNGCRNHDEILFWKWYLDSEHQDNSWIVDDDGKTGGLARDAAFVIAGDLNADPVDGSGIPQAINALLNSRRVFDPHPQSIGAEVSTTTRGHANETHRGNPSHDTAQFNERSVGNLRVDYCLPSSNMKLIASQVFWPVPGTPEADWVEATDHRMVWIELELK